MVEFNETYEPVGWLRKMNSDGPIVDSMGWNLFDLSIENQAIVDRCVPINNKWELVLRMVSEENEIVFKQHTKVEPSEWIDEKKKIYDEMKLGKSYTYDLEVKNLKNDMVTFYEVNLVRVENHKKEEPKLDYKIEVPGDDSLSEHLEVISAYDEDEEDPFDIEFEDAHIDYVKNDD